MADDQKIEIGVQLDSNAAKELKEAIKAFDKFSDKVKSSMGDSGDAAKKSSKTTTTALKRTEKSVKESTKAFETFKGVLGGVLAADLIRGIARQTIALGKAMFQTFVVEGVRAAAEQEAALKNLAQQMRSTGEFSDAALTDFENFANQMQRVSTVGDETSLKMLALAKTFGVTNEEAKKLVTAAIDLAAAKGTSLESAVVNLGKSLSGLTGELGEAVGEVRNLTVEQLKAGGAIDLIGARFRGSALAATQTYEGATTQLGLAFGDLQQAIGESITQSPAIISAIKSVSTTFVSLTESVNNNKQELIEFVVDAGRFGIAVLRGIVEPINNARLSFLRLQLVTAEGKAGLQAIASTVMPSFKKSMEESADQAGRISKEIENIENGKGVLASMVQELQALQDALNEARAVGGEDRERDPSGVQQAGGLPGVSGDANAEYRKQIDEQIAMIEERNALLMQINDEAAQEEIIVNQSMLEAIAEDERASDMQRLKARAKLAEQEKKIEREKAQVIRHILGSVASLQNSKVKELATLGKAAAITQATMDTYAGATKALATIPFPFGFAAAAAVTAAGLVNVAKISGVQGLQTGITEVPGTGSRDNFPAMLAPKERVVDAGTNQDLKGFLAGANEMVPLLSSIDSKLNRLNSRTVVNIGNREVADVVRDEIQSGRAVV